jgi:hypothetical protein
MFGNDMMQPVGDVIERIGPCNLLELPLRAADHRMQQTLV